MSSGSAVSYDSSPASTPRSYSPLIPTLASLAITQNENKKAKIRHDGEIICSEVLEKYSLKEKIGTGGFGVVYRAVPNYDNTSIPNVQRSNAESVAIKIIHKKKMGRVIKDPELGMIPVEAFILRRISHKNIIKMFDFFQDAKSFYIVTELAGSKWENGRSNCASRDLFEAVDAANGLCEDECRHVLRQLLDAIAYLQLTCNLVHRDIKDENICVDADLNIKLIDFGSVARYAKSNEDKKDYFNVFHGTESYFAPEHVRQEAYRGPEAEMWSIGCVLYTCLRNHQPFADCQEILHRDITMGLDKYASPLCIDLIGRMLHKDASKRITVQEALKHPWLA